MTFGARARHLLQLLNQILDLSKVQAGRMGSSPHFQGGRRPGVHRRVRESAALHAVTLTMEVADDVGRRRPTSCDSSR